MIDSARDYLIHRREKIYRNQIVGNGGAVEYLALGSKYGVVSSGWLGVLHFIRRR